MSIDKIVKNWRSIYYNNRDIYNTETLESYFASLQNHNQEISPKFYLMLSQISTKEVYFIETDVPSSSDVIIASYWATRFSDTYDWDTNHLSI